MRELQFKSYSKRGQMPCDLFYQGSFQGAIEWVVLRDIKKNGCEELGYSSTGSRFFSYAFKK